jgi:hypothetical protein
MYAAHDAFRRDIDRLTGAATSNQADSPEVLQRWAIFEEQLRLHHTAEDEAIWPQLWAAATQPDDAAVVEAMQAEHAKIDPLLSEIDSYYSLRDGRSLAASFGRLAEALTADMAHEEQDALPLFEKLLGKRGWDAFTRYIGKAQGLRGAAVFFPWMLEGSSQATAEKVLRQVPPPVRVLYRRVWLPRYTRTRQSPRSAR